MHRGYVKLWRCSEDSQLYFIEPFTKWQAWMDLVMRANYKSSVAFVRNIPIPLERGQLLASDDYLSTRWKWSRNKVRRFLDWLSSKTIQQIIQHNNHVCRYITICKYEDYQGDNNINDTTDGTPNDTTGDTADDTTDGTHLKNNKKVKNINTLGAKISKPKFDPISDIEIPENLSTPEFRAKWEEWVNDLKARRKALTEKAAKMQLAKLAAFDVDVGIQAINDAMESRWASVFPKAKNYDNRKTNYPDSSKPATPARFGSATAPSGRRFGSNSLIMSAFTKSDDKPPDAN